MILTNELSALYAQGCDICDILTTPLPSCRLSPAYNDSSMDPVSAIGIGAPIIGTIDVVIRTISALRKLQERWKATDRTIISLLGQLGTLKAALLQISDWVSHSFEGKFQHHQLVMALEASIESCQLLLSIMDSLRADLA